MRNTTGTASQCPGDKFRGKDYGEIPVLHPNCIAGSWLVHAGLALRR